MAINVDMTVGTVALKHVSKALVTAPGNAYMAFMTQCAAQYARRQNVCGVRRIQEHVWNAEQGCMERLVNTDAVKIAAIRAMAWCTVI